MDGKQKRWTLLSVPSYTKLTATPIPPATSEASALNSSWATETIAVLEFGSYLPANAPEGECIRTDIPTNSAFSATLNLMRLAVLDHHGRIMVLMTHNTDLGDSFEREADDPRYFTEMRNARSPDGTPFTVS